MPSWANGIPAWEPPLLGALGSKEELLEAFRRESDPTLRVTALRALIALEVGQRRSDSGAAELSRLLESCAADIREADIVREAAILGLPFVSLEAARKALPELLSSSMLLRGRAIDLLEAMTFLAKAAFEESSRHSTDQLRDVLVKYVADIVADPATSSEDRARARCLLVNSAHLH